MKNNINLTSGEIASLWTNYMNDSMAKLILDFMLKDLTDPEIVLIVQHAHELSANHLDYLAKLFESENFAIPIGFSEEDVNMEAPWLYADTFCLTYVNHMARVGMVSYSGFLATCTRQDIRDYFSKGLRETIDLYNRTLEIQLEKGINARHPYIVVPNETDYVDNKHYLSGLNPFHEKRPLNSIEISYLYMNILTNALGMKLCLSFAQTSPNKVVQEFMLKGKEIAKEHMKIFGEILTKEDIEVPEVPDASISDSTTWTFSDKLMMFHISLLMRAGIGNYATAGAASQRSDLMVNYESLSMEVAMFSKRGADIMIENNWLEQPAGTKSREKLARDKDND